MLTTLTTLQTTIHELYQLDTSVPASGDEDWNVRLTLIQTAIRLWANEKGMMWRELWTTNLLDGTGNNVTGTATATYTLQSNFRFMGGFIRTKEDGVNWTYWPVVDEPKSELFKTTNITNRFCWITGNAKTGYVLNFSMNPANAVSMDFPYYKNPFMVAVSGDIFEMDDPDYCAYYTLSKLHENDGEGDRAQLALAMANEKMSAMKDINAKLPNYQANYVPDIQLETGSPGFGV